MIAWDHVGECWSLVFISLHQYSSSLALHVLNKINMIVTRGKLLGMSSYNSVQLQDKLNNFFTIYCNMPHIWWNFCCKKVQDCLLDKTLPTEEFYKVLKYIYFLSIIYYLCYKGIILLVQFTMIMLKFCYPSIWVHYNPVE